MILIYSVHNSYEISPSTPKHVLRRCISDLRKEFVELREFTTLEKQLTCRESHSCVQVSIHTLTLGRLEPHFIWVPEDFACFVIIALR